MILDIGAPVSIAGVSLMKQYLEEFDLKIEDMKSVSCNLPFMFGPNKRYVSESIYHYLSDKIGQKGRCLDSTDILS